MNKWKDIQEQLLTLLKDHYNDVLDGNFSDILRQHGFLPNEEIAMHLYRKGGQFENVTAVVDWKGKIVVLERNKKRMEIMNVYQMVYAIVK